MPDFVGSCLPFAATAPARVSRRDPRPSVAERHASAAEYGDAVAAAADALVESGLLLAGDAAAVVADAVARFPGGTR
jgi:hypothetical protein